MLIVSWKFLGLVGSSGFSFLSPRLTGSPTPCYPVASPFLVGPVGLMRSDAPDSSATGLVTVT